MTMRKTSQVHGLVAFLALALAAPGLLAQEVQCEGPEGVKRKERSSLIGERTFRRLSAVHEQLAAEQYSDALSGLRSLESGNPNDYESAMISQTYGYVYAAQGKYDQAVPYFEKALNKDALPNQAHFGLMYSLAQLYAGQDKHQQAVDLLKQYLTFQCDPQAQAYITLASSLAALKKYSEALPYIKKAIAKAGPDAKETWYKLELAIYFETNDFKSAAALLKDMLVKWPESRRYWEMLAGAYQELNQDQDALATWMLAYHKGVLHELESGYGADQRASKLLNIVNLNMYLELPYVAGTILDKEMKAGNIPVNEKNLAKLLSAWTSAREFDRAIATIDRLAPMKDTGQLWLQKAQLLAEKTDWAETIEAARQALAKGGLDDPGSAYLLIGIAANEREDYQVALEAFKEARNYGDRARRQAGDWIAFVQDRMQVAP